MLCLCLLIGIALLVTPRAAFEAISWNVTRTAPDPPPDPPPDAVRRIIKLAALHRDPWYELRDQDQEKEDLLATVGYLAKRELGSR